MLTRYIWKRCLGRLAADRLVVTGSTVGPWQVFESNVFGEGGTAAVLSAFHESETEPTACVDSWRTVTLPLPVSHLPYEERKYLQKLGVYSRFVCKAPTVGPTVGPTVRQLTVRSPAVVLQF